MTAKGTSPSGQPAASAEPRSEGRPSGGARFIEIVNWRKAQPRMTGENNPWFKTYTSLLDCEAFTTLNDASRVLIFALWMYAARTGRHVFPADPDWLWRKIPMLNSRPDLRPLMEARDEFGNPRPFVRYCEPMAAADDAGNSRAEPTQASQAKTTPHKGPVCKAEHSRGQEKREEENGILTDSGKESRENQRVSSRSYRRSGKPTGQQTKPDQETGQQTAAQQTSSEQSRSHHTPAQTQEKPESPKESEAAGPKSTAPAIGHSDSEARRSVTRDAYPIGRIPIWWSDPACREFSYQIFDALGLKMDPDSQAGRSERGTFAAWLLKQRSRLPKDRWPGVEEKAIAKAREIARYGKAARQPGAVWLSVMASEIEARAGPPAAMA